MSYQVKKIAKLYNEDFDEVAGIHVSDNGIISGAVWQKGGGKPRLSWDMEGNPVYGNHPKLDVTALVITKEIENGSLPFNELKVEYLGDPDEKV